MIELDRDSIPEMNEAAMLEGLNAFAAEVHANADDHGWWEQDRTFPEILMLCVSELSEALEEYRNGTPDVYCKEYDEDHCGNCMEYRSSCACNGNKPEGMAIELADCIIRILDYCGRRGIDIEAAILAKHRYNKTRAYRHGGKKC